MIKKRGEMALEIRKNMRDGKGEISILHLADKTAIRNGRLLAEITIPPEGSIGKHQHNEETEYYIILEGEGYVTEGNGEKKVASGDVVITGDGASHSIRNSASTPLKMIAVIITH